MRKGTLFSLPLAITVACGISAFGQASNTTNDNVASLSSASDRQRQAITDSVMENRRNIADSLIGDLESPDMDVRFYACAMLGDLRYSDATPALAKIITLEDSKVFSRTYFRLPLWGTYPAEDALIRIGNDSLGPLEENLATSDDPQVQKLSLDALQQVERDPDVARAELRRAIAHEPNAAKKHHLVIALSKIGHQKLKLG